MKPSMLVTGGAPKAMGGSNSGSLDISDIK